MFSEVASFNRMEINPTLAEIMQAYNGVAKWAKPESAPFSVNFAAMKPVIRKEPKGTVLVISPFNYPLWLSLPPVVCIFI
jgi:aldehyde dehydrogenase (NAD+)